jgi:methionyl-tRNA synthetase
VVLVDRYGVDAIRYFLLREVSFGADGVFSNEALVNRINSDLANDLGNLLSRTVAMIEKYFDGFIPAAGEGADVDIELQKLAVETPGKVEEIMNKLEYNNALAEIWKLIGRANKYIDETTPWIMAKDSSKRSRLGTVLYNLAESLRFISVLISPFLTRTPEKIRQQLGIEDSSLSTWDSLSEFGRLPAGIRVQRGEAVFPRLDVEQELKALEELQSKTGKTVEGKESVDNGETSHKTAGDRQGQQDTQEVEEITIDDFAKLDIRVAKVVNAEPVKKTDRLLKLTLELGNQTRQVVSGIARYYTPDELIGKKVILLANLKPIKLRGELSQGMILAAADDSDNLALLTVDREIPTGSKIS